MIDAYTIGITLALDNGVADGIAAIRRDLIALDGAVAASAANLLRLQASAGLALGAVSADLSRLLESARRAAASLPKPSAEATPPQVTQPHLLEEQQPERGNSWNPPPPRLVPATPSERSVPTPSAAQVREISSRSTMPEVGPRPASVFAPSPPQAPRSLVSEENAQRSVPPVILLPNMPSVRNSTPAPAMPQASRGKPEAVIASPREKTRPQTDAAVVPAIDYVGIARAVTEHTTSEAGRPIVKHQIERTHTEVRTLTREREIATSPVSKVAPSNPSPVAPAFVRSPAPPELRSTNAARGNPEIATPPAPALTPVAPIVKQPPVRTDEREAALPRALASGLPSAAPRQPSAAAPQTAIEVILDGAAIGRWMDHRLARAATRPPSGTTGFDPRLSPIWTTAPVAN